MSKITLSVKDRVLLKPLLPTTGRRIEMIIIASLAQMIEFSAEEVEAFEIKDLPNGLVSANPLKFCDKELLLTAEQVKVLKNIPTKVDEASQVTTDMLPLFDKLDAVV